MSSIQFGEVGDSFFGHGNSGVRSALRPILEAMDRATIDQLAAARLTDSERRVVEEIESFFVEPAGAYPYACALPYSYQLETNGSGAHFGQVAAPTGTPPKNSAVLTGPATRELSYATARSASEIACATSCHNR